MEKQEKQKQLKKRRSQWWLFTFLLFGFALLQEALFNECMAFIDDALKLLGITGL